MNRDEFIKNYWRFYILLENKFIKTLNYVELTRKNFKTYSIGMLINYCQSAVN